MPLSASTARPGWPPHWKCDPTFAPLLAHFSEKTLLEHSGAIYGLWPDLTLACVNPGWFRFAADNGGEPAISSAWSLNSPIESVLGPLKDFYASEFERCLKTGRIWMHTYECPSPDLHRKFRMGAHPLGNGKGLLLIHSLMVEVPHPPDFSANASSDFSNYRDQDGVARMCACCRHFRRENEADCWDWLPDCVASMPANVTHELCPTCRDYHFPAAKS